MNVDLSKLFNPRAIAVFGVSRAPEHPGHMMLYSLKNCGFEGKIYPINPSSEGDIMGLKVYESLNQITDDCIDLAIIIVAPSAVLSVMEQIAGKRIPFAIVVTAGFEELGTQEGAELQADLVEMAKKSGIRFVGPNCLGVYSADSKVAFFWNQKPGDGSLALISQSGSNGAFLDMLARRKGVFFNKIVTSGNEADLCFADYLNYFSSDPGIKVITAYLEGIKDGQAFIESCGQASARKPVVVFKVGNTDVGSRAALSHTGAMSGSSFVWEAAIRQTGLIRADSIPELLDIALAFSLVSKAFGRKIAIMGSPGGMSVIAADACERFGMEVADLDDKTTRRLRKILPPVGISVRNPIDMGFGAIREGIYKDILEVIDADKNVDVILALGGAPTFVGKSTMKIVEFAEELISVKPSLTKPLFTIIPYLPEAEKAIGMLADEGIPAFDEPGLAAKIIHKMAMYYEWLGRKL